MKLTLTATTKIVTLDGFPVRVWEGQTERGVAVHAFIAHIAVDRAADVTQFEQELQEVCAPSPDVAAYPDLKRNPRQTEQKPHPFEPLPACDLRVIELIERFQVLLCHAPSTVLAMVEETLTCAERRAGLRPWLTPPGKTPDPTPRVEWAGWLHLREELVFQGQSFQDTQTGTLLNPLQPAQHGGVTIALSQDMIWVTMPDRSSHLRVLPAGTDPRACAEALVAEMLVVDGYLPRGEQS